MTRAGRAAWSAAIALVWTIACDGSPPPPDAGGRDGAPSGCTSDLECDDELFCNGRERCAPDEAGADDRGCARDAAPCARCSETDDRCVTSCAEGSDADGDGRDAVECGGDDCDDADALRFPGAVEVCDVRDRDEDCDPSTFGVRDLDGDGSPDSACCNVRGDGVRVCGDDCDDARAGVHPRSVETCDRLDNDCDGLVDEAVGRSFYPDLDGDRFGDATVAPTLACDPPEGYVEDGRDCDDTRADVRPGLTDVCDGLDNDCRDGVDTEPGATDLCGIVPSGTTACVAGRCAVVCPAPRADCDGAYANGCESDTTADADHCGACGVACGLGGACAAGACDGVRQLAAGATHAFLLRGSGVLVSWGSGAEGELGTGTLATTYSPEIVRTLPALSGVAAGATFSCGWRVSTSSGLSFGDQWCWGRNDRGQLGEGSRTSSALPRRVATRFLTMDMRVSTGGDHACRWTRSAAGSFVDCWGANSWGQLGQGGAPGTPAELLVPTEVSPPSGFVWASGLAAGRTHTCAVGADQRVACWGLNGSGQVDGTVASMMVTAPTIVAGVSGVRQISVGSAHSCAVRVDGTVWCWGRNLEGQLGRGTSTFSETAGPVPGLSGAVEVASGYRFACARLDDGTVRCWGDGHFGQLGDGTGTSRRAPAAVTGIDDATHLTLGEYSTCVVRASGRVWCWGYNADGELADGTAAHRSVPVQSVDL